MKKTKSGNKEIIVIVAFIIAIALGEWLTYQKADFGFLFYALLIPISLIALSKVDEFNTLGKIAVFLLIVPMVRISEIFMTFGFFWGSLIFYCFMLFLVLFYVYKFKIKINYKIGLNRLWLIVIALILGILFGISGNYLFSFEKLQILLPVLVIAAFSEEILFRRMIQNEIKENYNRFIAILIPALIYGIFSFTYGLYVALFFFVLNIVLGFVYDYTDNITLCIIINLTANAILFSI